MKKIITPVLLILVLASACLPVSQPVDPGPQVDTQATIDSIVNTAAAQTLAAQPTLTPTFTSTPTLPVTITSTHMTVTLATTSAPDLTTTPATATSGSEDTTITATVTPGSSGEITLTPTLGVLLYGTLPPAVPFNEITLVNKSKADAYISLQLCDGDAKGAILEYPVQTLLNVDVPLGTYLYVVWVGGRQITGTLKVNAASDLTIVIFKDKVIVQ